MLLSYHADLSCIKTSPVGMSTCKFACHIIAHVCVHVHHTTYVSTCWAMAWLGKLHVTCISVNVHGHFCEVSEEHCIRVLQQASPMHELMCRFVSVYQVMSWKQKRPS